VQNAQRKRNDKKTHQYLHNNDSNLFLTEQSLLTLVNIIESFSFRNMSGIAFGSNIYLRQLSAVSTPKELCDLLGGRRVINKVIIFFNLFN
jgi:hypothetical protein